MTGNNIEILVSVRDQASPAMARIGKAATGVAGGLGKIAGLAGAANTLTGVATAAIQLAPAMLVLPGALAAGAVAMTTFKVATAGFGEALSAADPAAFAEATKDMAPAMVEAAKAARDVKDGFKEVQNAVQAKFWEGMGQGISDVGTKYLPILEKKLPKVASQFNLLGRSVLDAASKKDTMSDFGGIIDGTAKAMTGIGPAAGDALRGILKLASFGVGQMRGLGESVSGVAQRFRQWVAEGVEGGGFQRAFDGAIAGFQDLGAIASNVGRIVGSVFSGLSGGGGSSPLESLRQMTKSLAEFMATAQAQSALKSLGETMRTIGEVVQGVVLTALQQLAPVIVALAPAAQEVARAMGEWITGALKVAGPLLQGLAGFISDNSDALGVLVPLALSAVVAFKAFSILTSVAAWIAGTGVAARVAAGGVGALAAPLAAVAGVVGIGLVAKQIDDLNMAAAGGDPAKLDMMADSLHNMVGGLEQLATNPGSVFTEIGDEWDMLVRDFQTGTSTMGALWSGFQLEMSGFKLDPISFEVDTAPATEQVTYFMEQINGAAPMVNINGNTNGAAFALQRIMDEIAMGHEFVQIDGEPMPAQAALDYVIGLINAGAGTVDVNGNTVPAGQALADILSRTNNSRATVPIGANTGSAQWAVDSFIRMNNGRRINIFVTTTGSGGIASAGRLAHGGISSGLNWVGERGPELVKGMASGGVSGKGMRLVGERGPELVRMPPGSTVVPNGTTNRLIGQASQGGGGGAMVLEVRTGGNAMDDMLGELIRRYVRVRGGNVQAVLGR